jgi:hypothetical protein
MKEPLAQEILDIIYRDSEVRRSYKDGLADWILDNQARNAPLTAATLIEYLAAHQPELLDRLKINVRIQADLSQALQKLNPN